MGWLSVYRGFRAPARGVERVYSPVTMVVQVE